MKMMKIRFVKLSTGILLLMGLFYILHYFMPENILAREKIRDQEEILMLSNMTEEAREKYLKDKQENAAKRAFVTENSEKIIAAQANIERRRREEEIEREKLAMRDRQRGKERDIEIANKAQREYYSRMEAPKLIYKCNHSDREIAIAARIGNINRLLNEAEVECSGRYEVIKRKD